ncbi:MAG: HPr family phosphocarrier protein [Candidatus Limivivens sp.]|nr:HPr family phosphocarrier protein [Candidatus Limivivens sp.]
MTNIPVKFHKPEDIIRFVNIVNHFDYHVNLTSEGSVLDAKSIISAFSLSTADNVELQVHAVDCSDLLEELSEYICY